MKTREIISQTLGELKQAGYSQVSASELAHKTGLPARAVIASIKRAHMPNFKRGNEVFIKLVQHAAFTELQKPKSAILGDLA